MALINCPSCNAQISDKAVSCPKCGHPLQEAPQEKFTATVSSPLSSIQGRASLATLATWGYIILSGSLVFLNFRRLADIDIANRRSGGGRNAGSIISQIDEKYLSLELIALLVLVVVLTINGFWIHRAAKNAAVIMPDSKHISPGWSVGWFFVPIAFFWMPFKAVKQIWNASFSDRRIINDTPPTWMYGWWAAWIISLLISAVSLNLDTYGSLQDYRQFTVMGIISGFLDMVAGFMFLRIVSFVSEAQQKVYDNAD